MGDSPGTAPSRIRPRLAQMVGRAMVAPSLPYTPAMRKCPDTLSTSGGMVHAPPVRVTAFSTQPAWKITVFSSPSQSPENSNRTGYAFTLPEVTGSFS